MKENRLEVEYVKALLELLAVNNIEMVLSGHEHMQYHAYIKR